MFEPRDVVFFERMFFDQNLFPSERYGQAFCNWFFYNNSILFYEEDTKVAQELVWTQLVK